MRENLSRAQNIWSAPIIFICFPIQRVVQDIFSNFIQFNFVSDNVFVIIALPNVVNIGMLTEPFGDPDFKPRTMEPMVWDVPHGWSFCCRAKNFSPIQLR